MRLTNRGLVDQHSHIERQEEEAMEVAEEVEEVVKEVVVVDHQEQQDQEGTWTIETLAQS